MKRGLTVIVFLLTALPSLAQLSPDNFQILHSDSLFKSVTLRNKKYFVCEVDPKKYKIETFNKNEADHSIHTFQTIYNLRKDLVFAINGGMYQEDLSPLGLLIVNNKTIRKVNTVKNAHGNFYMEPNGIFLLDKQNKPQVVTTDDYLNKTFEARIATQSGPMLVTNGSINSNFTDGSANLHIRNGVGINDNGHVVFVISEERVNFYDLAHLFKNYLKCDNALYLDGFVSQYFSPQLQGTPKEGVRLGVFIAVSAKSP